MIISFSIFYDFKFILFLYLNSHTFTKYVIVLRQKNEIYNEKKYLSLTIINVLNFHYSFRKINLVLKSQMKTLNC
jgi:hypothetical protein